MTMRARVGVTLWLLAAGCGGHRAATAPTPANHVETTPPPPTTTPAVAQTPSQKALAELTPIEQDACACKDVTCAQLVQGDLEAWAKRHADDRGSQQESNQATKIAEEISDCMMKAMSTKAGSDAGP